jgi:hypothetical protein
VLSTPDCMEEAGTSWSRLTVVSTVTFDDGCTPHVGSAAAKKGTPIAAAMKVLTKRGRFQRRMEGFTFQKGRHKAAINCPRTLRQAEGYFRPVTI